MVMNTAREISRTGMVMGTWGNVSVRCTDNLMVITPSGMNYETLNIEDMVVVNNENAVVEGAYKPSVETPMHLAVYQNRLDVKAIVHVHSLYAVSFAVVRKSVPVILEETAQVVGHEVPVADYAICGSLALADNVVRALGTDKRAVLLANHGMVAVGQSVEEALKICYIIEKTARVAIYAGLIGEARQLGEQDIKQLNQKFKSYGQTK